MNHLISDVGTAAGEDEPQCAPGGRVVSEKEFLRQVVGLARKMGYRCYHTFDSRRSQVGFPDLVMVRGDRMLVVELKSDAGEPTPAQSEWLAALGRVTRLTVALWRPADWDEVAAALGGSA